MAISTDTLGFPPHPAPAVPIKGYLVKEEGGQLWIQDLQGMWIVETKDVLGRGAWEGVRDNRFNGTPGVFYVADGAEIFAVHTVTVQAVHDWPLALGKSAREFGVEGCEKLDALAERAMYAMRMNSEVIARAATYCMKDDTTGWGMVIHKDDEKLV